jgi:hypothetical protein
MERKICWQWDATTVTLGMEVAGDGPPLLLLPALSLISTRAEMRCLLNQLAPHFHVVTVDWPGFGDLARPSADWTPDVLSGFLNWFLSDILPNPHGVVAAGHAATYAKVADQLRPTLPKLAAFTGEAEEDVLAYMTFPRDHWQKSSRQMAWKRVNGEIKRRTEIVGIFPNARGL